MRPGHAFGRQIVPGQDGIAARIVSTRSSPRSAKTCVAGKSSGRWRADWARRVGRMQTARPGITARRRTVPPRVVAQTCVRATVRAAAATAWNALASASRGVGGDTARIPRGRVRRTQKAALFASEARAKEKPARGKRLAFRFRRLATVVDHDRLLVQRGWLLGRADGAGLQEVEEVLVELVLVGEAQAMWGAGIDLEHGIGDHLGRLKGARLHGNDGVLVSVNEEGRDVEAAQVLAEVGVGEGGDAVV